MVRIGYQPAPVILLANVQACYQPLKVANLLDKQGTQPLWSKTTPKSQSKADCRNW
jgi:hypothetical protein